MGGHGQFLGMDPEQCEVVRGMILALNALYLDEWRTWYAKARALRWAGDDREAFMDRLAHIDGLVHASSDVFGGLACRLSEECEAQNEASAPDDPPFPFPLPFPLPFPRPGGN